MPDRVARLRLILPALAALAFALAQIPLPASARDAGQVRADLAYGPDRKQKIDVYLPDHPQNAPILIMVHGGGWRHGDKEMGRVVDNKTDHWLPRGFIFVSVNYRLLPDADPLTQAGDVAAALAFVQKSAPQWGGDPDRVVMMGHSAGAHLVSLLSANPALAAAQGAQRWTGSVILDTAAFDMEALMARQHMKLYDDAFGADRSYWRKVSPSAQLTRDALPMLVVCSSTRKDKPCPQARVFAAKAAPFGARVEIDEQARTHGEINRDLGEPGPYTQAVDLFIDRLVK